MTDQGLFPRGKGSSAGNGNTPAGKEKAKEGIRTSGGFKRRVKDDSSGTKRKSSGRETIESTEKDWLFGERRVKNTADQKRPRFDKDSARNATGSLQGRSASTSVAEVGASMLQHHGGRPPRLEMVSFKKLTKGTLSLGVVFKVNEHDMVISLPSSLSGVVRARDISDFHYARALLQKNQGPGGGRGRYWGADAQGNEPLTAFFKEGQVVRCCILSLAKDPDGRHIELSLRASLINKGLSLQQLTQGSGVYGAVSSVEDHGYVVSLGLDGVTAFLPIGNAPSEGLKPGQPLEAVIKSVKPAARTLTLSADPALVASACAQGNAFNFRSVKPGMLVDAIVSSIVSNGIMVTFLGRYFAGCVDHNNVPVVSGDDWKENGGWKSMYKVGMQMKARVLVVDYPNKAIRLTACPHLLGMRAPEDLPPAGAILSGSVVRIDQGQGLLIRSRIGAEGEELKGKKGEGKGNDEETTETLGAYAHISRLSDNRVEHVEKVFQLGQQVRFRVTGRSLLEGWAAASLKASVLDAQVLRYEDLKPGMIVQGDVAACEGFGVLLRLGNGVRTLVNKQHLGDTGMKNPKGRFKVGSKMKGRVLTVDVGAGRATVTAKKSMVKDQNTPITTYDEATVGTKCVGFVTKVASFGLHVSFYGNVYGLIPAKHLDRHGIEDPSQGFTAGQVVSCMVRRVDTTSTPARLVLSLDVVGKTTLGGGDGTPAEELGGDEEDFLHPSDSSASCPFSPGQVVQNAQIISLPGEGGLHRFRGEDALDVRLQGSHRPGLLPVSHLADNASLGVVLGARLAGAVHSPPQGFDIGPVVVIEVDKRGRPVVSIKPLLLAASLDGDRKKKHKKEVDKKEEVEGKGETGNNAVGFVPSSASDVCVGDVLAGCVSRVQGFGVFVRFFGGFSALCPRAFVGSRAVDGPEGVFQEGDSIRCVAQSVDPGTGKVVVTLNHAHVPASPAIFLRSYLSETISNAAISGATPSDSNGMALADGERGEGKVRVAGAEWSHFAIGSTVNGVVVALKDYGVVLSSTRKTGMKEQDVENGAKTEAKNTLMVCPPGLEQDGVQEGDEVKVRVLSVDVEKLLINVTMDPELVKAGRKKHRRSSKPLVEGEEVKVKVVLAKSDANFLVAATSDGQLVMVQVADYHCPKRTVERAETPLEVGQEITGHHCGTVPQEGEGFWNREGLGLGLTNPYAGVALLVVKEEAKRKGARKRKLSIEEPPTRKIPVDSTEDAVKLVNTSAAAAAADPLGEKIMKEGKVPLASLHKGAEVFCQVTGIFSDRLEVRVAIKHNPRHYSIRRAWIKQRAKARMSKSSVIPVFRDPGSPLEYAAEKLALGVGLDKIGERVTKIIKDIKTKHAHKEKKQEEDESEEEVDDDQDDFFDGDGKTAKSGVGMEQGDKRLQFDTAKDSMVRVRASIHITACGVSGVDAPSLQPRLGQENDKQAQSVEARAGAGNRRQLEGRMSTAQKGLPSWHPLAQFHLGQVLKAHVQHIHDYHKEGSPFTYRMLELSCDHGGDSTEVGQKRARKEEVGAEDKKTSSCPNERIKGGKEGIRCFPRWDENLPIVGQVHRGVVSEVVQGGVFVSLSLTLRGLVPKEMTSKVKEVLTDNCSHFQQGMGARVVVVGVDASKKKLLLSMTDVPGPEVLEDAALPAMSPIPLPKVPWSQGPTEGVTQPRDPVPGDIVEGEVEMRERDETDEGHKRRLFLNVRLRGGQRGRVGLTELADEDAWENNPLQSFVHGQKVRCRVLLSKAACTSLRQDRANRLRQHRSKTQETHVASEDDSIPTIEEVLTAEADIRLKSGGGQPRDKKGRPLLDLSLRPSRLLEVGGERAKARLAMPTDGPAVGSVAKAYVVGTSKSGCFLTLDGGVSGRVLLKNLANHFVDDPVKEFPPGRLVAGRVLNRDVKTGKLTLTLKSEVVVGHGGLTWKSPELQPGLKVKGRVSQVKDFGLFIQFHDSEVRGMCHRSEAAERNIDDLQGVYEEGDLVKAKVLKVDHKKKRVTLGLKPSYFEDDESSDSSDDDGNESDPKGFSSNSDRMTHVVEAMKDKSDEEEDILQNLLKEQGKQTTEGSAGDKKVVDDGPSEKEEASEESVGEEEEDKEEVPHSGSVERIMSVFDQSGPGDFSTGGLGLQFEDFSAVWKPTGSGGRSTSDEDVSDEDKDDHEDKEEAGTKSHKARKRAREKREEEERIRAKEESLVNGDAPPETAGDFERLLVANPNSSFLWVKFMAFQLSLADMDAARSVCERALKTISFREEQERFNLWVALLNVEHTYGTTESLKKAFHRACQNTHPKRVHLHLAEMHEKAGKTAQCQEAYEAAIKKFRQSKKVWMAYQLFRLKLGDDAGARELLQRSLKSLARHKHVTVISRFAQVEYEHGSLERGRSVFEGLLASYPRRLDLWNVYLDKEIKAGDRRGARNLFERLTGMNFNPRRMKSIFKKYLQYEVDHGDPDGVEAVKAKAKEYVASLRG